MAAKKENSPEILDVAIIGGGVSGLYSGWRLLDTDVRRSDVMGPLADKRADGKLRVELFELSGRAGGRLLSLTPPEMPDFKAEFGGMRFLTNQRVVSNLVDYLDLPTRPFSVNHEDNIYYLRGQHLRQKDFDDPDKLPYRVKWLERGKSPGQLIVDAIDTIIPGASRLSHIEWREIQEGFKFNGEHLYDLGFWNLLHQVLSGEAYKLLLESGGYVTTLSNWNAAAAMPWFLSDFGPEATYLTINNGMESLPLTLAGRFTAAGGAIHYGHRLRRFLPVDQDGERLYRVEFADQKPVLARHVVLAMPRRSLELLDQEAPFFKDPAVAALVPTVSPHPMFKLFMCYRYPWWRDAGITTGRSITDLPLRQVYYFGSEPDPGQYEAEIMDSLLMASYDDGRFVGFWSGMLGEYKGLPDHGQADPNDPAGRWHLHAAPPVMVQHAQRQLKLVHDLEYMPEPYAAAFVNWGIDPFGGAWNSWNVRVKSWEVQEAILQPRADWPVYVVGEAYSGAQGWIEGALQTAETMLQDKLDVRPPRWLPLG